MSTRLNPYSSQRISSTWRGRVASLLAKVLAVTLLGVMPVAIIAAPGAGAIGSYPGAAIDGLECSTDINSTSISLTPSQGLAFYVDGSEGAAAADDFTSNYLGYRVRSSDASIKNVWVKVGNFSPAVSGISLGLISATQNKFQLSNSSTSLSETKTAFFAVTASGVSSWTGTADQVGRYTHDVQVWSGDPDAAGSTLLKACRYTFKTVQNTLGASSNKVTRQTISKSSPALGETVTLTVEGNTGQIGGGKLPDSDIIWLSANPYSNFPADSLRLENTKFELQNTTGCTAAQSSVVDQILITGVNNSCYDQKDYKAYYTFKVIGSGSGSQRLVGIANIASGNQTKHSVVDPAARLTINLSGAATIAAANLTFEKGETHTVGSAVESITALTTNYGLSISTKYYKLYYVETVTSTSSTPTSLDYLVDSGTADMKMDTSTVYVSYDNSTWTYINPLVVSDKYYFPGPFSISSSTPVYIRYTMYVGVNTASSPEGDTTTATNKFYGLLGTSTLGSTVNTTTVYDPTGNSSGTTTTQAAKPGYVLTKAASSITTTSAVLNGYGSDSPTAKITYKISRVFDSVTATSALESVTASFSGSTENIIVNKSGLLPHTTYYYEFYQTVSPVRAGGVVDFTTLGAQATTAAATSVTKNGAVLNGNYVLNGETYTIYYDLGTDVDLTSDTRTITVGNSNVDGALTGSATGLTANTKYYFRICVQTNAADLVGDSELVCGAVLNFTTSSDSTPAPSGPSLPPVNITWPSPNPITNPTPLGSTQLNANATCNGVAVTGSYIYSPALGTVLAPGTYTLSVTFVPNSGSACGSVSTTVTIVVNEPPATITWPNPPSRQGPARLGPTELNAVCSVPGRLVYDPTLGTLLPAGTYTLKVTCIPNDPTIPSVSTDVVFVLTEGIEAPKNAKTSPITFTQGSITWDAVPNAVGYSVDIRGSVVCKTTTATSCTVKRTIGPKTPVIVTAIAKNKRTASARAVYSNDKLLTAIEVNFATSRFNIDTKAQNEVNRVSAIIKREGFTFVEITGHTDPRGGALNVALSKNRAKSLAAAMTKLVPGLTFKDAGLSYDDPVADNKSAAGMAKNRRSVGAVK